MAFPPDGEQRIAFSLCGTSDDVTIRMGFQAYALALQITPLRRRRGELSFLLFRQEDRVFR
jgi:hypothetical protein